MTENIPENADLKGEAAPHREFPPYASLNSQGKLDTLSWYLVVLGFVAILFAALCIYLAQIRYRDYVLNARVLGGYLLGLGISLYAVGRGISYFRRFQRRRENR
jgi:hypothetical protein